jgi:hypothetical protein
LRVPELSRCLSCDFETTEALTRCPKCGRRVRALKRTRWLGMIQVVLGGFLVLFMGGIWYLIWGIVSQSGRPGATTRFTGTAEDIKIVYGLFAMVIAIGFGSIAGGVWQLRYGKPNKVIVLVIVGLAVLLYIGARAYTHSKS